MDKIKFNEQVEKIEQFKNEGRGIIVEALTAWFLEFNIENFHLPNGTVKFVEDSLVYTGGDATMTIALRDVKFPILWEIYEEVKESIIRSLKN